MALGSINQFLVVCLLVVAITVQTSTQARRGNRRPTTDRRQFGCPSGSTSDSDVYKNITALWSRVNSLRQPFQVHVHSDEKKCDDYFGCDFMDHSGHSHGDHGHSHHAHSHHGHSHGKAKAGKNSHKHGRHASHAHASHAHGSHGHGSHAHGSHGHGSHASHGPGHVMDNHIHIHLSVNNKDDCKFVSYAPKDEFVYARCDMQPARRNGRVKGSILMRQKPHGILETKVKLNGFGGPSVGAKDGKHDYFFDLHKKADFSKRCASFGTHDHVHHDEGNFDHEHNHNHEDDRVHNHAHHDGHNHSVHDHHAHEDDWGNVIINDRGVANMEVNCTHHELYGPESMLGKGLVLHDKDDNPVSCCAITYADIDDDTWDTQ